MKSSETQYQRALVAAAREAIVVWKDAEHASLFFSQPKVENSVYNYLLNTKNALDGDDHFARQRHAVTPRVRLYEIRVLKQFAQDVIDFPDFDRNRLVPGDTHSGPKDAVVAAMRLWYVLNEPKMPPALTPPEEAKPTPKYNIEGLSDDELARRMRANLGISAARKPGAPDSSQPRRR